MTERIGNGFAGVTFRNRSGEFVVRMTRYESEQLATNIAAGTQYDMDLSLVLAHTTNVDEDMEALGWQALASGDL